MAADKPPCPDLRGVFVLANILAGAKKLLAPDAPKTAEGFENLPWAKNTAWAQAIRENSELAPNLIQPDRALLDGSKKLDTKAYSDEMQLRYDMIRDAYEKNPGFHAQKGLAREYAEGRREGELMLGMGKPGVKPVANLQYPGAFRDAAGAVISKQLGALAAANDRATRSGLRYDGADAADRRMTLDTMSQSLLFATQGYRQPMVERSFGEFRYGVMLDQFKAGTPVEQYAAIEDGHVIDAMKREIRAKPGHERTQHVFGEDMSGIDPEKSVEVHRVPRFADRARQDRYGRGLAERQTEGQRAGMTSRRIPDVSDVQAKIEAMEFGH